MHSKIRDKTYKEPPALRHLRRTLTEKMAHDAFYNVFDREPHSDQELAIFIEQYTLEMYNGGHDEWPELRRRTES